jgi:hypothetical protein
MSEILNIILLGAHVKSETSGLAQWNAIIFYYAINLLLVFLVVAGFFALSGAYQPFVAPLATPAIQVVVATTNLVTFVLMYIASFGWEMNEAAIGPQRAAYPSKVVYWSLLIVLTAISLFIAAFLFLTFNLVVLLVAAVVNSTLLQFAWSRRFLSSIRGDS